MKTTAIFALVAIAATLAPLAVADDPESGFDWAELVYSATPQTGTWAGDGIDLFVGAASESSMTGTYNGTPFIAARVGTWYETAGGMRLWFDTSTSGITWEGHNHDVGEVAHVL